MSFIIADKDHLISKVDESYFVQRKLYKCLSLIICARYELLVPNSLLLMGTNRFAVEDFISINGLPLLLRMDYSEKPKNKPLGGIPIKSKQAIMKLAKYMLSNNLFPLLHEYYDRFSNEYSCGALMSNNNNEIVIELVAPGFDASDLRLGISIPHETIEYNFADDEIKRIRIINPEDYVKERINRIHRVSEYYNYIKYANMKYELSANINKYYDAHCPIHETISKSYQPISEFKLRDLTNILWRIKANVISKLPNSNNYVASLSFIPDKGWVIWDIYGHWYQR